MNLCQLGMEPTIEELRNNYRRFPDARLIRIATTKAAVLRPEAIQVVEEEIRRRGLSSELLEGIKVQRKYINEFELLKYCELLSKQPCPVCSSTSVKLNATMKATVISLVFVTTYEEELLIACPDCLNKANRKAMFKTALLGWWEIPGGIYETIKALKQNNKMLTQARLSGPNSYFKEFVHQQIGTIEANKTNEQRLQSLVRYLN